MNTALEKLRHIGACPEALRYVEGAGDCDGRTLLRGARAEWVVWIAAKVLPGDRRVVHAASACARAVMHKARPVDVGVLTWTLELVDRWGAGGDVSVDGLGAAWLAAWVVGHAHRAGPSIDLHAIIDTVIPLEEIAAAFDALTVDLAPAP